jgi:ABC-type uncharacterized transport system involved in gliding motility auxiliary subunit
MPTASIRKADLLVLFHPKNMSDTLAFAVDQYILGGGNAIVFADPLSLMDDPRMGPGGSIPTMLFKSWGITMQPERRWPTSPTPHG